MEFVTAMYSLGLHSSVLTMHSILLQGTVSSGVALALYVEPRKRWIDGSLGVAAALVCAAVGCWMLRVVLSQLPRCARVQYVSLNGRSGRQHSVEDSDSRWRKR